MEAKVQTRHTRNAAALAKKEADVKMIVWRIGRDLLSDYPNGISAEDKKRLSEIYGRVWTTIDKWRRFASDYTETEARNHKGGFSSAMDPNKNRSDRRSRANARSYRTSSHMNHIPDEVRDYWADHGENAGDIVYQILAKIGGAGSDSLATDLKVKFRSR